MQNNHLSRSSKLFEISDNCGFTRETENERSPVIFDPYTLRKWLRKTKVRRDEFEKTSKLFADEDLTYNVGVSVATLKRVLSGEPVSLRIARAILLTMDQHDENLSVLLSLRQSSVTDAPSRHEPSPAPPACTPLIAPSVICGKWFAYHITKNGNGTPYLAKTQIHISENGKCSLSFDADDRDISYSGSLISNQDKVAAFEINRKEGNNQESVIWKLPYKSGNRCSPLCGVWIGPNFQDEFSSGDILLSEHPLADSTAIRTLEEKSVYIQMTSRQAIFDGKKIWKTIGRLKSGSTVRIISSFIPDLSSHINEIEKEGKQSKKLKWRIILINPDDHPTLVARLSLHGVNCDVSNPPEEQNSGAIKPVNNGRKIELFRSKIEEESEALKYIRDTCGVDIKLRYSSGWFAGQAIMAGDEVLFMNYMFATKTAMLSPGVISYDRNSKEFSHTLNDFRAIWRHASIDAFEISPTTD